MAATFFRYLEQLIRDITQGRSKMHLKIGCFISVILLSLAGFSQPTQLSPNSQISVLTCGTGDQLYSSFGHSSFRVQDPARGIDLVYNYGTFDFDTPNFYLKFASGKLLYSLSREQFPNFLYTYQLENRWVKEQILDLSQNQQNAVFQFLENNYRPENRDYKYDFIYENCSTKIPEVLEKVMGSSLIMQNSHLESEASFRELVQSYLHWNTWASFGIDLAFGAVMDQKARSKEYMFLPDYVLSQLSNSTLEGKPLVQRERTILDLENGRGVSIFTISPLFWFLLFFIFTLTITYIDFRNQTRSRWLDFCLFVLTGATGLFIIFLWFFTDHTATANNFNIAWAFPVNLYVAFLMRRKGEVPHWIPRYIQVVMYLLLVVPLLWITGLQHFPPILILILLTLAIRYAYLHYYYKDFYPLVMGRS